MRAGGRRTARILPRRPRRRKPIPPLYELMAHGLRCFVLNHRRPSARFPLWGLSPGPGPPAAPIFSDSHPNDRPRDPLREPSTGTRRRREGCGSARVDDGRRRSCGSATGMCGSSHRRRARGKARRSRSRIRKRTRASRASESPGVREQCAAGPSSTAGRAVDDSPSLRRSSEVRPRLCRALRESAR